MWPAGSQAGLLFGKGASPDGLRAHSWGPNGWTYGGTPRVCIFHKAPRALPSPRWVPATLLRHGERGTGHLSGWPGASPPREGPPPEAFLTLCPELRGTGQNPEFLSRARPDPGRLPQVQRLPGAAVVGAQVRHLQGLLGCPGGTAGLRHRLPGACVPRGRRPGPEDTRCAQNRPGGRSPPASGLGACTACSGSPEGPAVQAHARTGPPRTL